MSDDPRKAKTLGDAARNPDGTYDGFKALSWLTEALHPGQGVPEDEVHDIWEGVRKKRDGDG